MRGRKSFAWFVYALLGAGVMGIAGCGSGGAEAPTASIAAEGGSDSSASNNSATANPVSLSAHPDPGQSPARPNPHPEVVIKTSLGDIKVRLDADKAPITVDNFLANYVDDGFYDGTTFHYVEEGFMARAGGYTSDLTAKETRSPIRNEAENGLKNVRGAIAMVRDPQWVDSATSQFYINLADNASLDYKSQEPEEYGYCVFGKVVEGMDVVDEIAAANVADQGAFANVPVKPIVIESIRRVN